VKINFTRPKAGELLNKKLRCFTWLRKVEGPVTKETQRLWDEASVTCSMAKNYDSL